MGWLGSMRSTFFAALENPKGDTKQCAENQEPDQSLQLCRLICVFAALGSRHKQEPDQSVQMR